MEGRSGGGEGGQRRGDVLSTRLKASVNASFLRLHSRPLPCEVRKGGLDGGGVGGGGGGLGARLPVKVRVAVRVRC